MIYTYGDDYGGVGLIDAWGDDKRAVHAARVSFHRDDDNSDLTERDVRLLKFMIKEGHTSPFEHSGMTVKVVCPLFVRAQIMRHRTFSFNEVSRRYTEEEMRIYVPQELRTQADKNLQCSVEGSHVVGERFLLEKVTESALDSQAMYEYLLKRGVSREQARGVLPQNMYTMFWMSGNLHNWYKFLKLRLHEHTQPETRLVAQAILDHTEARFPVTTLLVSELTGALPLRAKGDASDTSRVETATQSGEEGTSTS